MKLVLKHRLFIYDYTPEMLKWCNDNLTFDNPEYISRERLGKWTGNVERKIVMFERNGNDLILPFGVYPKVWRAFADKFSSAECDIKPITLRNYNSGIETREYQERAIQAVLRAKNGILVAPCGSGKTQMGLEIAARIGGRTLWLTHTADLLNQSLNRAKECFDMPESEFGTITGGKINIGGTITFATVQTMNNICLPEYKYAFDAIIVDECHHIVGSPTKLQMFYNVLSQLVARYKIGLTATLYRSDGLEGCMFSVLGDIIHTVKRDEVERNTCPVEVRLFNTGYSPNLDVVLAGDGTVVYSSLVKDLTENKKRNENVIISLWEEIEHRGNGATIILSDRIDHLYKMYDLLPTFIKSNSVVINGNDQSKSAKEARKRVLSKLNDGEISILFATYKLAKEGLDVPNLKYVVLASPIKDKTTVIQAAGRVARKTEGKTYGTIIDFSDDFGLLKGYERKRKSIYKKLGYTIV